MRQIVLVLILVVLVTGVILHFPSRSNAVEISSPTTVSYTQLEKNVQQPQKPVIIRIPAAKVHASIEELSIVDGTMQNPTGIEDAGWYKDSVYPGVKGHAVIAGHLDDEDGEPAVFARLHLLRVNDVIFVTDADGVSRQFFVNEIKEYSYTNVPLATLFTNSISKNLILITCSGTFDTKHSTYEKRLVVYTTHRQ